MHIATSCEKEQMTEIEKSITGKALYDNPLNKLWFHKADTLEKALKALENFPGIEFDIVYDTKISDFDVRYSIESQPVNINLEKYFSTIKQPKQYYYWIDFKNLDSTNCNASIKKMKEVLKQYDLFDNVIIESKNADQLGQFALEGFFTSYWTPHVYYNKESFNEKDSNLLIIRENLKKYHFNALSGFYTIYDFFHAYFPESNYHLWTNGLISNDDKKIIDSLSKKPEVKVILVDYKENFLNKMQN